MKKPELPLRICSVCGKQYVPQHKLQKYCSYTCSYQFRKGKTLKEFYGEDKAKKVRNKIKTTLMKPRENKICLGCGGVFERKVGSSCKFCSHSCATKYWWKNKDNSERCGKIGKALDRKVELFCPECGKKFKIHRYRIKQDHVFCSRTCEGKWRSKTFIGSNNSNWQGGTGKLPYPFGFDKNLKEYIKIRDNYICQLCREKENLCIHHINYDKDDLSELNLTTLCRSCNGKVNSRRDFWEDYFTFRLLHGIVLGGKSNV